MPELPRDATGECYTCGQRRRLLTTGATSRPVHWRLYTHTVPGTDGRVRLCPGSRSAPRPTSVSCPSASDRWTALYFSEEATP